jgi:fatty-acyl-CoA synthase
MQPTPSSVGLDLYVKFVDSFPITINGKTQKYKMWEISIQEMGLEEAAEIATA